MATEKDAQIFTCGVVQYSMSSGKFEAADIPTLTKTAYAAFCEVFGPPTKETAPPPRPSPAPSQGPFRASQPWQAAPPAASPGNPDVPMETKSFSMWGGDKCYLFDYKEALWSDLVAAAQNGDVTIKAALEKAAKAGLGKDPQWHKANAKRIGRAKACLKIIADGQRTSAPLPPQQAEPPAWLVNEAEWQPGDGDQ